MPAAKTCSCGYKDRKWISAIAAVVLLGMTLLLFNAAYVISKPVATEVGAVFVASLFSPNGLDDPAGINAVRERVRQGERIRPIPELTISLSRKDIESKSPREIRLTIFRQITEAVYEGPEGIRKLTGKDLTRKEIMSEYGLLAFVSRRTHEFIRTPALIAAIITLVPLALLIYFSRGWGRLVSPALTIGAAALPWLVLFGILWFLGANLPASPADGPLPERANQAIWNTLPVVTTGIAQIYAGLFLAALVALIIAGAGKLVSRAKTA